MTSILLHHSLWLLLWNSKTEPLRSSTRSLTLVPVRQSPSSSLFRWEAGSPPGLRTVHSQQRTGLRCFCSHLRSFISVFLISFSTWPSSGNGLNTGHPARSSRQPWRFFFFFFCTLCIATKWELDALKVGRGCMRRDREQQEDYKSAVAWYSSRGRHDLHTTQLNGPISRTSLRYGHLAQ